MAEDRVYILNLNNVSGPPPFNFYNSANVSCLARSAIHPSTICLALGPDRLGNVFVSNLTTGNIGSVIEFPHGKMPGVQLSGVSLGLPGAPTFDSKNNLIITDWLRETIDVFSPRTPGRQPRRRLWDRRSGCKLNHQQSHLYCGDADLGSIDVYAYPGNAYKYSYTAGLSSSALVTGVAPAPPAAYGR